MSGMGKYRPQYHLFCGLFQFRTLIEQVRGFHLVVKGISVIALSRKNMFFSFWGETNREGLRPRSMY